MTKKLIKQLVDASYIQEDLDGAKAAEIGSKLKRRELKEYIHALKVQEKKKNIYIESATSIETEEQEEFIDVFKNKKVIFQKNESLLFGIRITSYDDIYELNMKSTLDKIQTYINQDYD